jgi:hypothetical protein
MAARVTTQIDSSLIEEARRALTLGDDVPAIAVVRKALIDAIGDDDMTHEVKRGRPVKRDA